MILLASWHSRKSPYLGASRLHISIVAPLHVLLLVVLLAVLIGFVELGVLTAAFDKLGLSAHSAYLLLITTLAGSVLKLGPFCNPRETQPRPALCPQCQRHPRVPTPPPRAAR